MWFCFDLSDRSLAQLQRLEELDLGNNELYHLVREHATDSARWPCFTHHLG